MWLMLTLSPKWKSSQLGDGPLGQTYIQTFAFVVPDILPSQLGSLSMGRTYIEAYAELKELNSSYNKNHKCTLNTPYNKTLNRF